MLNIPGKNWNQSAQNKYWCMLFQLTSHYITLNKLILEKEQHKDFYFLTRVGIKLQRNAETLII